MTSHEAAMVGFWRDVADHFETAHSMDLEDFIKIAERWGLIRAVVFDPEQHDEGPRTADLEAGDPWYVVTPLGASEGGGT